MSAECFKSLSPLIKTQNDITKNFELIDNIKPHTLSKNDEPLVKIFHIEEVDYFSQENNDKMCYHNLYCRLKGETPIHVYIFYHLFKMFDNLEEYDAWYTKNPNNEIKREIRRNYRSILDLFNQDFYEEKNHQHHH